MERGNRGQGQGGQRRSNGRSHHQGGGSGGGRRGNSHYSNRRGGRPGYNRRRGRGPGGGGGGGLFNREAILRKYYHFLEAHNVARKKYYENFHKEDPQLRAKLERQFYETLEALRKFEKTLNPDQQQLLKLALQEYQEDLAYSQNHELDPGPVEVVMESYEDPHLLQSQLERKSYKEDTEESVGSMDDYRAYKGG